MDKMDNIIRQTAIDVLQTVKDEVVRKAILNETLKEMEAYKEDLSIIEMLDVVIEFQVMRLK